MKQWDIYLYKFETKDPHPVVILSSNPMIQAGPSCNGLFCRTIRAGKPLRDYEVPLDRADGLDWSTGAQCSFIYELDPKKFLEKRGEVSLERRRQISKRLWSCFQLVA